MMKNGEIYFYLKDDEHGWLSNFWPSPFTCNGINWKTNEHYYQAQKASTWEFMKWIADAPNPYHAMLAGRKLRPDKGEMKADWEERKLSVMERGLRRKFNTFGLRQKLLDTGDTPIHEDSQTDMFWGCRGEDWLGRLLVKVREDIKYDRSDAIEILCSHLEWRHPRYTTSDVVLSNCRGYLRSTKPCSCNYPPYDGHVVFVKSGSEEPHFHTISIEDVGYRARDRSGQFVSKYKLWDELKAKGFPSEGVE